jgi:hypothetical protein
MVHPLRREAHEVYAAALPVVSARRGAVRGEAEIEYRYREAVTDPEVNGELTVQVVNSTRQ